MTPDLSLVIACYHDAPHLERNVRAIKRILDATRFRVEWIFVEDHGDDGSDRILDRIRSGILPEAKIILHAQNMGRGRTVRDGFDIATGRVMGFLDIDLAVSPVYIPAMVNAILEDGTDLAVARRVYRTSLHPGSILRDFLSYGYRSIVRHYLDLPFEDTEAGYKFFRRDAYEKLKPLCQDPAWFWDTELMAHAFALDLSVHCLPCLFQRDKDKATTVKIGRDTWRYLMKLRSFRAAHGESLKAAAHRRTAP